MAWQLQFYFFPHLFNETIPLPPVSEQVNWLSSIWFNFLAETVDVNSYGPLHNSSLGP